MLFNFGFKNKTINELRKKRMYTAKELAEKLKINTSLILKIDNTKLKDVPEPLKSKLIPFLDGSETNKIPWL
ncbi:MAG: transcriptional regulator [Clostridia bacterium]